MLRKTEPLHRKSVARCTSASWRAALSVVVKGETTQQSRGLTRLAQEPRQGTLAIERTATATARRAVRPQRQEIRSARAGTYSHRARQKAHLADIPTCCDGIADHRFWYSPWQSVTARPTDITAGATRPNLCKWSELQHGSQEPPPSPAAGPRRLHDLRRGPRTTQAARRGTRLRPVDPRRRRRSGKRRQRAEGRVRRPAAGGPTQRPQAQLLGTRRAPAAQGSGQPAILRKFGGSSGNRLRWTPVNSPVLAREQAR